ncbi:hypothetical protein PTI98_008139 [Pleurotus ostreatus]|nr:hypothetical protein PTI98_008139 [Pleurotus ostreatus]
MYCTHASTGKRKREKSNHNTESDIALADLRDKGFVPLIRSCGHGHFVVPVRPAGNGGGSEDVDDSTLPNGAVTDDGAVTEEDEDGDLGGYGEVNG